MIETLEDQLSEFCRAVSLLLQAIAAQQQTLEHALRDCEKVVTMTKEQNPSYRDDERVTVFAARSLIHESILELARRSEALIVLLQKRKQAS